MRRKRFVALLLVSLLLASLAFAVSAEGLGNFQAKNQVAFKATWFDAFDGCFNDSGSDSSGYGSIEDATIAEDSFAHTHFESEGVFAVDSYDELDPATFVENIPLLYEPTRGVDDQFNTSDLAALDFAKNYYKSSEFTRIEWAATIYKKSGKYYYYAVHFGKPHSVGVSTAVPSGATYVGYVHTHPNSPDFSPSDKDFANTHGGLAYVVTPSYYVKKYNSSTKVVTTLGKVTPYSLNPIKVAVLIANTLPVWLNHIAECAANGGRCPKNFGCENKSWPNI
ncbi:MAG: DUF4329 domain-containing protein [Clostridia bacterium]|nr:DUF4329 domain-containing protein [Clostridia bacterium]